LGSWLKANAMWWWGYVAVAVAVVAVKSEIIFDQNWKDDIKGNFWMLPVNK